MKTNYNGYSKQSGIYKIYNKLNGRIYIGSSKEFKERFKGHLKSLKQNKHHNSFLQRDFNKCGTDAFIFEVIKVVEGNKEIRLQIEQEYIDQYFDNQILCYNICDKVEKLPTVLSQEKELERRKKISQTSKGRKHTEKTRKKISNSHIGKIKSEQHRKNIGLSSTGRKMSDENKQKLSERMKGNTNCVNRKPWNKGKKLPSPSKETRQKRSESMKNIFLKNPERKQKISDRIAKKYILINSNGIIVKIINLRLFCKKNNLSERSMRRIISGERKTHKGWTFLVKK